MSPRNDHGCGLLSFVYLGLFSMMFAEVFAGSSLLWFIDPWSILVTYPLYLAHILFFWTLALKLNRRSLRSLYLFGVLFGMYESWITKVVWFGFFGNPPILGRLFGFAIVEVIMIVLFWHPVMSFLMPIVTTEIIYSYVTGKVDPDLRNLLLKTRRKKIIRVAIIFTGAVALAANSGGNIIVSLATLGGSLLLIYIVFRIIKSEPSCLSPKNMVLGRKGLVVVTAYLVVLYLFMFFNLLPERIPSIETILLTVIFYIFVVFLIYLDKPMEEQQQSGELYTFLDLKKFFIEYVVLLIALSMLFIVMPTSLLISFLVAIIVMVGVGIYLFISAAIGIITKHGERAS